MQLKEKELITYNKRLLLWVIFIIYITDSLMFATNSIALFTIIRRIAPLLFAGLLLLKSCSRYTSYRTILAILACVSVIFSAVFSGGYIYFYITTVAILIFGYSFSRMYSLDEFSKVYVRVLLLIACVSIVCELCKSQIANIGIIPTIINTAGVSYKNLLLTTITTWARGIRNQGPFWEPGAYQVYLNVALYFALFSEMEMKKKYCYAAVFCIALVTTGSGAAIFPAALIVLAYVVSQGGLKRIAVAMGVVLAVFFIYQTGTLDYIIGRSLDTTSNSFQIRFYNIWGNIVAYINNPLLGASVDDCYKLRAMIMSRYGNMNYSDCVNTFPAYFAYFGTYVGCYFLLNFWRMIKSNIKHLIPAMIVFVALMLSTSNENMTGSLFIGTIIFLRSRNYHAGSENYENNAS